MQVVEDKITIDELKILANKIFGDLVKAVVDIDKSILVVDSDLHSDEEAYLLENGSKQENLWGINIYPELGMPDRIEFDSMINIRPSQGNNSRSIDDPKTREKILEIVSKKIS
ncbi:hypothetical protein H6764_00520 [Candidatus Nomurabacteria bacterium]|nr:hypothetical protein [Candidatus Nomurabacteria bacterium]